MGGQAVAAEPEPAGLPVVIASHEPVSALAETPLSEVRADSSAPDASEVVTPSAIPTVTTPPAVTSAPPDFAELSPLDRMWAPSVERDRTIWFALAITAVLQLGVVASWIDLGDGPPPTQGPEPERRGQVDTAKTVEVELVEAPSETADRKPSQEGADVKPTPPAPDQPPQEAQPEQQEIKEAKAEPAPETPPEKPQEQQKPKAKPLSVDDFDVSLNDYAKAVERAQAQRKLDKQEQQTARSSERARDFGAAPVGKQSAYTKATLAMLSRTKPDLFITRGQVYVRFLLDRAGKVRRLELIKSSGDALLDSTIVDWLKRAKYEVPPPDAKDEDLLYDIHFTVR